MKTQKLLSIGNDSKTVKGEARGYRTAILYLAPSNLSGRNVCPHATPGCIASCLNTAGRGIMSSVQQARIKRTLAFFKDREAFLAQLHDEIAHHAFSARHAGMIPVVRLNGTSDISWESFKSPAGLNLFQMFPDVHFYDYTKNFMRACRSLTKDWPKNYRLVLSRSESNQADCERFLALGGNVAMVFATKPKQELPMFWDTVAGEQNQTASMPVIDGDKDDLRFLDPSPCIVGLRAKGKARQDQSGFVIR